MQRTKILSDKERFIRDVAERLKREAHELPAYQTHLHALAGLGRPSRCRIGRDGACVQCGRYA